MGYALLADVVVAVHVAYVAFVIVGELAVAAGAVLRWRWVRNLPFRLAHLLAILIVAGENLLHIQCPLTVWESRLRELAGQAVAHGTFMGRLLHDALFYDFQPWVFRAMYVGFAALVLLTLVFAPPRWDALHKWFGTRPASVET